MKKLLFLSAACALVTPSIATQILPGPETSLQTIINDRVTGLSIDVNADQVANDSYWTAALDPAAYLLIELAGYAGDNAFGIYQYGSPGTKQEIFAGAAAAPSSVLSIIVPNTWTAFGFYMTNANVGFTWYSDPTLNAGGGLDHFVAFQGAAGGQLQVGGLKTFDANDYIIAIEDLNLGDKDYNDMVLLVQNITPHTSVPDGGTTLILMALGLLGLQVAKRRLAAK